MAQRALRQAAASGAHPRPLREWQAQWHRGTAGSKFPVFVGKTRGSAEGGLSSRSQEKRAGDQIKSVVSHGNQQNDFAQRTHKRDVRTINKRPRLGPISLPFPSVRPRGQQRERPLREMRRSQGVVTAKPGGLSQRFNGKSHRGVTCRTLDTGPLGGCVPRCSRCCANAAPLGGCGHLCSFRRLN